MRLTTIPYGTTQSQQPVTLYRLQNDNEMEVDVISYGAIITAIRVPDRTGKIEDIALGYDDLAGYENGTSYLGAVVGRYGNRIAKGRFTLEGKTYTLPINNGPNSLHGGPGGFDRKVWKAEPIETPSEVGLRLTYISPDGEEGYPGTLTAVVIYTLNNENELRIRYELTTDAPTIANLTNHSYFNLKGDGNGTILDHLVQIDADHYTPTDETLIPTGEIAKVEGTPMDFRHPTPIGARIDEKFPALIVAGGYDHNYVLNGSGLRKVITAYEPSGGRQMEVFTTEPGVQFYTGNFLENVPGKQGRTYPYRGGFCFETQHFPDSPNHPHFPSTLLRPGEIYQSQTIYKFSAR